MPSPTVDLSELARALVLPPSVAAAEASIEMRLQGHSAVLFASCRAALAATVAELSQPGGSVAISGYTCTAVPNGIVSGGSRPVYVDVDECGLVNRAAWPDADVVVVQDTYGFGADVPEGRTVVRDAALCATGFACDAGVLVTVASFEHSKALSSGQGGLALTRNRDLAVALRTRRDNDAHRATRGTGHALLTLLEVLASRQRYRGRRLGVLGSRAFAKLAPKRAAGQSPSELRGEGVDPDLLGRPSRAVASLIATQFARSHALAANRMRVVEIYDRAAGVTRAPQPLSRYPMHVPDLSVFDDRMREAGWNCSSRWFSAPLHPAKADPGDFGYAPAPDSNASALARSVVNLPTHRLVSDADASSLIRTALAAGARPLCR